MIDREPAAWLWLKEHLVRLRQATRPGQAPATGEPAVVVRTAVVTDSAAALPADWVRAFSINGRLAVIPMPVMVGADVGTSSAGRSIGRTDGAAAERVGSVVDGVPWVIG